MRVSRRLFLSGQGAAGSAAGLDELDAEDVTMGEALPWPFSPASNAFEGESPSGGN